MRPSHATMLFSSQRLMEEHVVESIPNTTNAEEAMHWRFYSAAGRDHSFMHGMMSLYKIAIDFERQFEAVGRTLWLAIFLKTILLSSTMTARNITEHQFSIKLRKSVHTLQERTSTFLRDSMFTKPSTDFAVVLKLRTNFSRSNARPTRINLTFKCRQNLLISYLQFRTLVMTWSSIGHLTKKRSESPRQNTYVAPHQIFYKERTSRRI